jgi:low temperature requirement protein LtrA
MVEDGMSFTAATQPNTVLQTLYLLIGIFVALCLILSIFIEFKHQQPMQVAYSIGLLALLGGLFYAHTLLTSAPIIS